MSCTQKMALGVDNLDNLWLIPDKSDLLLDHWNCTAQKKFLSKSDSFFSQKSYSMPIGIEFQRRYATIVLELEQLNKDLNKVLHKVQQFCYEVSALHEFSLRGLCPLHFLVWSLIPLPLHFRKSKLSQYLQKKSFGRTIFYIFVFLIASVSQSALYPVSLSFVWITTDIAQQIIYI